MSLSGRIRPNVEAARWVCDEVKQLENERDDLLAALEACEMRLTYLAQNNGNVITDLKQARAAIAKAKGNRMSDLSNWEAQQEMGYVERFDRRKNNT